MGIALPGAGGATRQSMVSGAQVIDGSLRFQAVNKEYLYQTIDNGTSGFTLSLWMKPFQTGNRDEIFDTVASTGFYIYRHQDGSIRINNNSSALFTSNGLYRDSSAFYHIVFSYNSTAGYGTLWVNGRFDKSTVFATQLYAGTAKISSDASSDPADYSLAQWHLIDGQQLGPSYFAYTDPLTNTWRPKKFRAEGTTANDGTTWSSSGSGTLANGNWGQAFDGTRYMYGGSGASNGPAAENGTITFAPTGLKGQLVNLGVRGGGNKDYTVNGQSMTFGSGQAEVATIDLGSTQSINSIKAISTAGGTWAQIYWVEVDGVLLKDSTTQNLAFGTNGFYLPLDGNSPIGEDKSGKGNNWTPSGFGGSVSLDNPIVSGARPILNTDGGGNVARPGVFGSEVGAFYATTSASNSGGKYYFSHDASAQPTFSFIRGATYTFDYSASSSHPLRFATAADAAGNTEYTNGTNTSVSNVISFTVPHNAPDTLYYYCNVHNGMGNSISVTTDESKADPYAWKCILALPLLGANDVSGDMNCTTTNDAITNNSLSFNSNQSIFYNQSADPDGSQYLSGVDLSSWNTEQPWTVEFWWYRTGANTNSHGHFIGGTIGGTNQYGPTYRDGSHNDWQFNFKGQSIVITPSPALLTDKWEHHTFTSNGNNISYFRNGVFQNTTSASSMTGSWGSSNEIFRGGAGWSSQFVVGHVCDMRVYTAEKYTTAGFIPASTNPDILPDTPSGVSGSSKLTKITDGAVVFDGTASTGDYLLVEHGDMAMGTGDFTVEFSVYNKTNKNYNAFISTRETSNGTTAGFVIASDAAGDLYVHSGGAIAGNYSGDLILPLNQWCHVAYTRSGGTHRLFLNGIAAANSTTTSRNYTEDMLVIGDNGYAKDEPVNGFISNVRVIKGTALYTSNFTPPSATPLTNVTNTKLLCCQSNATSGAAAVSPNISGVNNGTVWSHQNSFVIALAGTTETGSLAAVFNPTTGVTGAADSFGFLNGAFDYTYTPNTPISYSSKVRVWTGFGGNVYLNNGSAVSTTSNNWTTLVSGSSGTVDSIRFTASGSGGWWSGLEIDDVMLVDPVNTGGNAAATTFNPFTTDINAVRGQETGYTTWNPLTKSRGNLLDGNLLFYGDGTNTPRINGTISQSSGKWYYESTVLNDGPGTGSGDVHNSIGWGFDNVSNIETAPNNSDMQHSFYFMDSGYYKNFSGSNTNTSTGKWLAGDVIGVAADLDNNTLTFYKNNVQVLSQTIGTTAGTSLCPAHQSNTGTYGRSITNFGQKPFKFPPPAGFQPLNAANVRPDTVITRPDQFVSATLYSGNNGTTQVTTGFQPDFVWLKGRSETLQHRLVDSVRGQHQLYSNSTAVEGSWNNLDILSNGFNVTNDGNEQNKSGTTYVAWTWKAGGSKNTFNVDDVGYASATAAGLPAVGSLSNKTQLWSGLFTLASGSFDQAITNAFNGSISESTRARTSGNAVLITMTLSTPVTVSSEIKVFGETGYDSTCTVTVGGITYTSSSGSVHTFNVSGSLTRMTLVANGGSGRTYFEGMEIDSKILVDSNVSVNVPSIVPTGVSVGTRQGFSIVSYTSESGTGTLTATIPHGLNENIGFMIIKSRDFSPSSQGWAVWHQSSPTTNGYLDSTGNFLNSEYTSFIDATPTNSVFSVKCNSGVSSGNRYRTYGNSHDYIAYLWHDVPGLQKFGRYSGISSADGPFIELGFRPSMILLKKIDNTDSNSGWHWYDNQRNTYNPANNFLLAGHTYYENRAANNTATVTSYRIDFLSTGFKFRHDSSNLNVAGSNYIYAAWAEAPTFNLFGGQSNAR